jgi:hypothetical protein
MSSQIKQAEKKKNKAFWPLIGFALAVSLGILAYFLKDPVYSWLNVTVRGFPPAGIAPATMKLVVAGALFLVMGGLVALIISLAVPKDTRQVKTTDLVKERKMKLKDAEIRKRRQQQINRQNRSGR